MKDIEAEIQKLEELKTTVRPKTAFGESNVEAIEAQIDTLRNALEEDDVYDRLDAGDFDERQKDSALEAIEWRDTESNDEPPSKGWEPLVTNRAAGSATQTTKEPHVPD